MPGTIGRAFERHVAAEAEIGGAGRADRPAAALLRELEQRTPPLAHDRRGEDGFAVLINRSQHLILQPGDGSGGALLFGGARFADELAARQAEAGEFAD